MFQTPNTQLYRYLFSLRARRIRFLNIRDGVSSSLHFQPDMFIFHETIELDNRRSSQMKIKAKIDNHFQVQESNLVRIAAVAFLRVPQNDGILTRTKTKNNLDSHDPIDCQITPPGAYFPRELYDTTLDTATRAASRTIVV